MGTPHDTAFAQTYDNYDPKWFFYSTHVGEYVKFLHGLPVWQLVTFEPSAVFCTVILCAMNYAPTVGNSNKIRFTECGLS